MGQRCGAGDYFDDLVHNLVKVNLNSLSTSWFIRTSCILVFLFSWPFGVSRLGFAWCFFFFFN
jgi:hypothetical protein